MIKAKVYIVKYRVSDKVIGSVLAPSAFKVLGAIAVVTGERLSDVNMKYNVQRKYGDIKAKWV